MTSNPASGSAPSTPAIRTAAVVLTVADGVVLLLAAVLAGLTYVELRDPGADPLTAIGYLLAILVAGLAVVSLLFVGLSRVTTGAGRIVCLVLAAVPLAPLATWAGTLWW